MPARSERMYIFPDKNGEPCLIRPFPHWWNRSEFIKKYQHREIDLGNPIDANYVWLLNSAEAITWNEKRKEDLSHNSVGSGQNISEDIRHLESALRKSSWVIVESYEWESGMD
jgi:hypothetical protein